MKETNIMEEILNNICTYYYTLCYLQFIYNKTYNDAYIDQYWEIINKKRNRTLCTLQPQHYYAIRQHLEMDMKGPTLWALRT